MAAGLARTRFDPTIMTFYPGGAFAAEARDAGVVTISLDKRGRWDLVAFQSRLVHDLRNLGTKIVHAFDMPPNLVALAARPFVDGLRVIWGIRSSNMDLRQYDYSRRISFALAGKLSARPNLMIANSYAGRNHLVSQGFADGNLEVVPNGIDTKRFSHDEDGARRLREAWCVTPTQPLIGIVARFDPKKDHATFLRAAAMMSGQDGEAKFICIGDKDVQTQYENHPAAQALGDRLIWDGLRGDMPSVYTAIDVLTLTSGWGEGFPNVIGEAMACGTVCVATDVGDAARIVDDLGYGVPVGEPGAIVDAWQQYLSLPDSQRRDLALRRRQRIEEKYSLGAMIAAHEACYDFVLDNAPGASRPTLLN